MLSLKQIIEKNDTREGKIFAFSIQILIIISLVSFSLETLPDLSSRSRFILDVIETVTVIIFTIEYLLRLWVAENKLKFIFSFYGIIDLLAILPFYIAKGIDLRSIRIVRLFRLFRMFKVLRYSRAIHRISRAFKSIKEELILFIVSTGFLLYLSSVGIYYFESGVQPKQFKSIFHCLWWSVVTLTTVGYGDAFPITTGGKIFTSIIAMIGIGVVAVPTGLIASALTKVVQDEVKEKEQ
ncbi:ion transporter [Myxococcota bacterium]|nr:ion transporter [Myxococcota bacterium]MBU1381724.1 ion transporter [Myxococcota bacterium]MBU1497469.1 ion transporter [Myxococcota bacterium]